MSSATPSRYPKWWAGSLLCAERATPWVIGPAAHALAIAGSRESVAAMLAARVWRWAARGLERLREPQEPRNAEELLAYARTLEKSMPNLAAELRCLACKGQ